jgi:prevent-host-death family protein
MITVSAAEFQRYFGRYQDEALTQPVVITRNGRERLVMLSIDEYRRLRRRSREVIRVEDLSDEEVAQIAKGRMDPRHDHLDAELKQGICAASHS